MDIEKIPLDAPKTKRETYLKNYREITRESGKLMLFAGDQKVEHLKPLDEAIRMCDAIYAVTIEGATVEETLRIYKGK